MRYIILGASAAGISAAIKIRELDKYGEIIIISSDKKVYSRCMLHHILGKVRDVESTSFVEENFFEKHDIQWIKGRKVIELNAERKNVLLNDGTREQYDKLLIATGAVSQMPRIKNIDKARGVFGFRDIEHVEKIEKAVQSSKTALIIGAGLVGMDAAVGLLKRGIKVSIVEMYKRILPIQLDDRAAFNYKILMEKHGAKVFTDTSVVEVINDKNGNVKAAVLNNGMCIQCDMIIVATGVKPNTWFIKDTKIKLDRGIAINERCKTTLDSVYAAGDVCGMYSIWVTAVKQGITAAYNMTSNDKVMDDYFTAKNSMNFLGLETVSFRLVEPLDDSYRVDIFENKNVYKKIISKNGIICGAIFQGDISYCGLFGQLIKNKVNITGIKKNIFELNYADFYEECDW